MNFQNILDKLMAGDARSFVILGIIAFMIFVVMRFLKIVLEPYQDFIKLLAGLGIVLGIYIWVVNPELRGRVVSNTADWIMELAEPLFADDGKESLEKERVRIHGLYEDGFKRK